jgi:hypothetical protein
VVNWAEAMIEKEVIGKRRLCGVGADRGPLGANCGQKRFHCVRKRPNNARSFGGKAPCFPRFWHSSAICAQRNASNQKGGGGAAGEGPCFVQGECYAALRSRSYFFVPAVRSRAAQPPRAKTLRRAFPRAGSSECNVPSGGGDRRFEGLRRLPVWGAWPGEHATACRRLCECSEPPTVSGVTSCDSLASWKSLT